MKKFASLLRTVIFLSGGGLCLIAGLSSCENFLKASEVKAQIEYEIAYANAKDCKVYLSQDSGYGSFLAGGQLNCKVGYETQVQFTIKNQSYIFKGLRAVSTTDKTASRSDCVEFKTIQSDDEKGVYKLSVKILKAKADILIEPVCHEYPSVLSYTPQYSSNGVASNSVIQCDFNVELDQLPQGSVSFFCGSENITSLYKEPELSENKKTIIIKPKSSEITAYINKKGLGFLEITVSLAKAISSTQDGQVYYLSQNDKSTFDLRLNAIVDNNAPAFMPDSFKAAASRQAMENGNYYDLSYKYDESSEIINKAIASVFFKFDVYENESSIAYIKVREQAVATKDYIQVSGNTVKEYKSDSDPADASIVYPFKDFTCSENNNVYSYDFEYQLQTKKELFVRLEITACDEAGHATANQQLDFCKYNIVKDDVKFFIYNDDLNPVSKTAIEDYFIKNEDGSSDAVFNLIFSLKPVNDSFFANTKEDYTFEYAASKSREGLENEDFVFAEGTHGDSKTITIHIPDISSDTYIKLRAIDKYGFTTDNIFVIPGEAIPLYYFSMRWSSSSKNYLVDFYEDAKDNIIKKNILIVHNMEDNSYFINATDNYHHVGDTFWASPQYPYEFYTQQRYQVTFDKTKYNINGPTKRIVKTDIYTSIFNFNGNKEPGFSYKIYEDKIECTFDFTTICNNNNNISKIFLTSGSRPETYFTAYIDVTSENKIIVKRIPSSFFNYYSGTQKYSIDYHVCYITSDNKFYYNENYYPAYLNNDYKPEQNAVDTTPPEIDFGTNTNHISRGINERHPTRNYYTVQFKEKNYNYTSKSTVNVHYSSDSYNADLQLPVFRYPEDFYDNDRGKDYYYVHVPVKQIPVGEYCDITVTVEDTKGNVGQATIGHVNIRQDFTYDFDPSYKDSKWKFKITNDKLKTPEQLAGRTVSDNKWSVTGEGYSIRPYCLSKKTGATGTPDKLEWKSSGTYGNFSETKDYETIIDNLGSNSFIKIFTVKYYKAKDSKNSTYTWDYQDSAPKYMYSGGKKEVAVKDILELINGVQVYSSQPILIHTICSPFDYGNNIDDWEYHCNWYNPELIANDKSSVKGKLADPASDKVYQTELKLVYEISSHTETPYYYPFPKVPSGMYYTTIIYFADNTALQTKVKYAP